MKHTVLSCTRRRDEKYLVTYRLPGPATGHAVSDRPVSEGQDVVVRDGKVVET